MSGWAIVALVAIAIWGIVSVARSRAGIARDKGDDQSLAAHEDAETRAELEAARSEVADLRERVKVLERIATDANTGDARETARIAAEIEALRGLPADRTEGTDQ